MSVRKKPLAHPHYSVHRTSAALPCCIFQRCSCTTPTCKCGTRSKPHANFVMMLKGKSEVKTKSMGLETLPVARTPLPLGGARVLGELPTAREGLAAGLQGRPVHGPSSETITPAVQLGLISLILSSAACWNHREQSTFYFC